MKKMFKGVLIAFIALLCTSFLQAQSCAAVDLDIRFDGFPAQTSWNITDASGTVVLVCLTVVIR